MPAEPDTIDLNTGADRCAVALSITLVGVPAMRQSEPPTMHRTVLPIQPRTRGEIVSCGRASRSLATQPPRGQMLALAPGGDRAGAPSNCSRNRDTTTRRRRYTAGFANIKICPPCPLAV
jgi:hypothetical protein